MVKYGSEPSGTVSTVPTLMVGVPPVPVPGGPWSPLGPLGPLGPGGPCTGTTNGGYMSDICAPPLTNDLICGIYKQINGYEFNCVEKKDGE